MGNVISRQGFVRAGIAMGALAAAGCGVARATEGAAAGFAAGTYRGTGIGKNGDVVVECSFSDSRLETVEVVSHSETAGICDLAIVGLPRRVVDTQSTAVDVVSGATLSSMAVLNAVRDCVGQACGDDDALEIDLPEPEPGERTVEADVIVVGAGGAGLVAACEAASRGKSVVVVEKQSATGGSTRLNGAMFVAPACHGLVPANADEPEDERALTVDELTRLYTTYGSDSPYLDAEMVADFVSSMNDNLEFLADYAYRPVRYLYPGWLPLDPTDESADPIHVINTEPRLAKAPQPESTWSEEDDGGWPDGIGPRFTAPLEARVRQLGGTILLDTEVTALSMDNGAVSGVVARGANGVTYQVRASSVVLASGGFGGNADLREKYWGDADYLYGGTYANDGACIQMAADAGALVDYVKTPGSDTVALYNSVGGVVIDGDGRVLDEGGDPVPGLFAAGEITDMRFMGSTYPICGSFNQWSVFTGRRAGAAAAEE